MNAFAPPRAACAVRDDGPTDDGMRVSIARRPLVALVLLMVGALSTAVEANRMPLVTSSRLIALQTQSNASTADSNADRLNPAQWEPDIAAFEAADREHPPKTGGVLFIGSSSIRLWTTLQADFPDVPVLNRGFGGSQIREVTAFSDRIVIPYAPRVIVFYCGPNDITEGRSPEKVASDYKAFVSKVHASVPATRIAFISAAPNPARWHLRREMQQLNQRVRALTAIDHRLDFIDVWTAMLDPHGQPRPELFVDYRLHMNAKGYAIWREIVGKYLHRH
jgi:lysophospholipase L1-like esterase